MNLTLRQITEELYQTEADYSKCLKELLPLENKYTERYNKLMLNSPMGNQNQREAEALETLRLEPIFLEYKEAQLQMRILYSKRNTLIEIGKNLRSINIGGEV